MAQFKYQFETPSLSHDKSQPRPLSRFDPPQLCNWVDCSAKAVSKYKSEVYCARHLLRTLQQQWQE